MNIEKNVLFPENYQYSTFPLSFQVGLRLDVGIQTTENPPFVDCPKSYLWKKQHFFEHPVSFIQSTNCCREQK